MKRPFDVEKNRGEHDTGTRKQHRDDSVQVLLDTVKSAASWFLFRLDRSAVIRSYPVGNVDHFEPRRPGEQDLIGQQWQLFVK